MQPKAKRVIKYILLAIAALIMLFLVVVAIQPNEMHVERTATIPAPPADVFAQVNDFHKWQAWSPWERVDPNMKRTLSGPTEGEGAKYGWVGNADVGEGEMTIAESRPNELIRIKLEFFKPFAGTNTAEFTFKPVGDGQTSVTWAMFGPKNFLSKAICLFMDMDQMIGGQFDQGLANLKTVVETKPQ
jgi:uncharacterized protein YndB with AHSA1/START domain